MSPPADTALPFQPGEGSDPEPRSPGLPARELQPGGPGLRAELPPERLQLEWVYGYRGRDGRSNLHVLGSGELVYFVACAVVLLDLSVRRQRHYLRHTDCVRCLAVHPDRVRVATGQAAGVDKDGKPLQPLVHIWDSSSLLLLQQLGSGSFERGVGSLAFSIAEQGTFLCVVDDSNEHMMSVWDWARGTKQAEIKSTNESVLTVEFDPRDSSRIITGGKSHVYFWTWSGASLSKKQGIFGVCGLGVGQRDPGLTPCPPRVGGEPGCPGSQTPLLSPHPVAELERTQASRPPVSPLCHPDPTPLPELN
ncbi:hypothetical protein Y1Q_0014287 [Alligator mississippiensis]|uniref:EML-like first beta-propeller domain-containing protein n=1 Tax=Alligator mississippiensis TaxID=8496 RepID=A0A151M3Q2_ALLMI|nr:hypothetical protein Y1Q_0014287 [Alligator mississippiensis]